MENRNKFRYFVSYSITEPYSSGFGSIEHQRNDELDSVDKIKELARGIEEDNGFADKSVVVMWFNLFTDTKEQE